MLKYLLVTAIIGKFAEINIYFICPDIRNMTTAARASIILL